MDTNESRLNAAAPCGVIRDGHQMTMVRLDDLQSLCGAAFIYEREGKSAREKNEELARDNADLRQEVSALRKGVATAIQTLESTACALR